MNKIIKKQDKKKYIYLLAMAEEEIKQWKLFIKLLKKKLWSRSN